MSIVQRLEWSCVHGNQWVASIGDQGAGSASGSLIRCESPELCLCWTSVGSVLMDNLDSGSQLVWTA